MEHWINGVTSHKTTGNDNNQSHLNQEREHTPIDEALASEAVECGVVRYTIRAQIACTNWYELVSTSQHNTRPSTKDIKYSSTQMYSTKEEQWKNNVLTQYNANRIHKIQKYNTNSDRKKTNKQTWTRNASELQLHYRCKYSSYFFCLTAHRGTECIKHVKNFVAILGLYRRKRYTPIVIVDHN